MERKREAIITEWKDTLLPGFKELVKKHKMPKRISNDHKSTQPPNTVTKSNVV